MDIILIHHQDTSVSLTLEPIRDTLFLVTGGIPETSLDVRLEVPGVRAFIFGLFHTEEKEHFSINQEHSAPDTESHVLLKTVVMDNGNFSYQGKLSIHALATGTRASQEIRGLLQGENSRFKAVPALEIIPKDVVCKHKASSAPVNKDSLFTLQNKGLSESESRKILETAFINNAFETLSDWGLSEEEIVQVRNHFSKLQIHS